MCVDEAIGETADWIRSS